MADSISHTTFSSILEADHSTINRCAGRLRRAFASLPTNCPTPTFRIIEIRNELIWRLIRHDVSEELVMRPAFIRYLGDEGIKLVEGDRHDHGDAKTKLLALLPLPTTSPIFQARILALLTELNGHMTRESGSEIPALESAISRSVSRDLADKYARTQILTPELEAEGGRVFSGLEDYITASIDRFKAILGWEGEASVGDLLEAAGKAVALDHGTGRTPGQFKSGEKDEQQQQQPKNKGSHL